MIVATYIDEYLTKEIHEQGYSIYSLDGVYKSSNDIEVQKIIDIYDSLPSAKIEAKARIVKQSNAVMQSIEDSYPEFEKKTWTYQKYEVEAWALDNNALTPTIDAIALARGVDRLAQLTRVKAKVVTYSDSTNKLTGLRQKYFDDIESSTDIDFISSINFVI